MMVISLLSFAVHVAMYQGQPSIYKIWSVHLNISFPTNFMLYNKRKKGGGKQ